MNPCLPHWSLDEKEMSSHPPVSEVRPHPFYSTPPHSSFEHTDKLPHQPVSRRPHPDETCPSRSLGPEDNLPLHPTVPTCIWSEIPSWWIPIVPTTIDRSLDPEDIFSTHPTCMSEARTHLDGRSFAPKDNHLLLPLHSKPLHHSLPYPPVSEARSHPDKSLPSLLRLDRSLKPEEGVVLHSTLPQVLAGLGRFQPENKCVLLFLTLKKTNRWWRKKIKMVSEVSSNILHKTEHNLEADNFFFTTSSISNLQCIICLN